MQGNTGLLGRHQPPGPHPRLESCQQAKVVPATSAAPALRPRVMTAGVGWGTCCMFSLRLSRAFELMTRVKLSLGASACL